MVGCLVVVVVVVVVVVAVAGVMVSEQFESWRNGWVSTFAIPKRKKETKREVNIARKNVTKCGFLQVLHNNRFMLYLVDFFSHISIYLFVVTK